MDIKLTLKDIAYCGLNCRLCNLTTILPDAAAKLLGIMRDDGWELYGPELYPEFAEFWKVLADLSGLKESCPMCKGGCGNPECVFRICARDKGLELCADCPDYPCQPLQDFYAGHYAKLAVNNERIREIGLEAWLEEQQQLVERGLSFKDLV
ncbi:MAG: DUF3795 domain-containing protein [Candidatus Cloacimonetes bacterium]|jgi:hypothetical protein|nr:DUF3795 domain-containing protein [Candidatus Cloacimonadota bacterium]MDD3142805.1 DUF3795 domain-containing protein [Candidatus Cloacimonadota bacterium]MDY0366602.1 DUF3795 domain-containing protein [Candidatus Syntrophosphaera sp.]HOY85002.1 DUF3795 domain-containing protein [Candidatus Syntrophosphaera sp.]HPH60327.1 DUF3795 domain-containing protein [Candidatus Syntrophosphaera sp.]